MVTTNKAAAMTTTLTTKPVSKVAQTAGRTRIRSVSFWLPSLARAVGAPGSSGRPRGNVEVR
jgi:hypothetical protein